MRACVHARAFVDSSVGVHVCVRARRGFVCWCSRVLVCVVVHASVRGRACASTFSLTK